MVLGYLGFDLQSLKITMGLLDCNPIIKSKNTSVYAKSSNGNAISLSKRYLILQQL